VYNFGTIAIAAVIAIAACAAIDVGNRSCCVDKLV
jgi:hypothetical protein